MSRQLSLACLVLIAAAAPATARAARPNLLMIIADVLKTPAEHVMRIEHYAINVTSDGPPEATVAVSFQGKTAEASATGDGGYDAFMRALTKAVKQYAIEIPRLADYRVRIPPGGRSAAVLPSRVRPA